MIDEDLNVESILNNVKKFLLNGTTEIWKFSYVSKKFLNCPKVLHSIFNNNRILLWFGYFCIHWIVNIFFMKISTNIYFSDEYTIENENEIFSIHCVIY